MQLTVTNLGIQEAARVGQTGHQIRLATFKLFSFENPNFFYSPAATDAGPKGILQFGGPITSYKRTNFDTFEFVCLLPETAKGFSSANGGSFYFNEVGLYTDTGVLFALGVLGPNQDGSGAPFYHVYGDTRLKIRAQIKLAASTISSIAFNLMTDVGCSEWAEEWLACQQEAGSGELIRIPNVNMASAFHPGRKIRYTFAGGVCFTTVLYSSNAGADTVITVSEARVDSLTTVIDYGILGANDASAIPALGVLLFSQRIGDDFTIPSGVFGLWFG